MITEAEVTWTPGPSGEVVAPTVAQLAEFLHSRRGKPGASIEEGRVNGEGWTVIAAVLRDVGGEPIAIVLLKFHNTVPRLVDVAVAPEHRGNGHAYGLFEFLLWHGLDARRFASIQDGKGPLTDQGRGFRDVAVARGNERYGELT